MRLANPAQAANVTLARPASTAVNRSASNAGRLGVPLQIGFARPVTELESAARTVDRLRWSATASAGQLAAFSVTSPEAFALRAGLRFDSLPAQVLLRFYAPGEGEVFEVTAEVVRVTIGRNLDAGEQGDNANTYWSPVIEGSTAVVEIELPAGVPTASLALAAPIVSHLVTSPPMNFAMPSTKAAASCSLDVTCYSSWANESNSVARITFTDGGASYLCTGTLVVDKDASTNVPFFLTANHCVSSQSAASSLVSYWFYRSTSCNSGARGAYQTLGGGAALLYNSAATDTSFLRLDAPRPRARGVRGLGGRRRCAFRGERRGHPQSDRVPAEDQPGIGGELRHLLADRGRIVQLSRVDLWRRVVLRDRVAQRHHRAGQQRLGRVPRERPLPDGPALRRDHHVQRVRLGLLRALRRRVQRGYRGRLYGQPVWYVLPGGSWSGDTYTGTLYRTATAPLQFFGAPFDPRFVSSTAVGSMSLRFSGTKDATMSYTIYGVSGTRPITRQPF